MNSKVLTTPLRFPEDYGLFYDIDVVGFNAKLCRSIAQKRGFQFRCVLKGGYVFPRLVSRLVDVGINHFCLGIQPPDDIAQFAGLNLATLYPGSAVVWTRNSPLARATETDAAALSNFQSREKPIDVLLPVSTTESREGLPPELLMGAMMRLRSRLGRRVRLRGFQLNFGCVQNDEPDLAALNRLLRELAGRQYLAFLNHEPLVSLGGSALLPHLDDIEVPSAFSSEFRIGEAILAGTVPGYHGTTDLHKPAVFRARVLQNLEPDPSGRSRYLIDFGSNILGDRIYAKQAPFNFESISSEVSVVSIPDDDRSSRISGVELVLGYHEIERALGRCRGRFNTKIKHVRAA